MTLIVGIVPYIGRSCKSIQRLQPGSVRAILVALICGLTGGLQAHFSRIAAHTPSAGTQQESLIMRFRRWVQHQDQTIEHWYLPLAQATLAALADAPLVLVVDSSVVGRGCLALMVSVVYHGRALPLTWLVVKQPKGHLPETQHLAVLTAVQPLIPTGTPVTLLGDGEFDGTAVQAQLTAWGWTYVCRTGMNIVIHLGQQQVAVRELIPPKGEAWATRPVSMTAAGYGPVGLIVAWDATCDEPLAVITTLEDLPAALALYRQRAQIETFFSDQKSRGFKLQRSHLADPARVERLLIAACAAYVWIIYLGTVATRPRWMQRLHRQDRCDLSLFQLGLRLLADVWPMAGPSHQGSFFRWHHRFRFAAGGVWGMRRRKVYGSQSPEWTSLPI